MKTENERLQAEVGRELESIVLRILFYSVETRGALGVVILKFSNATQYFLGCAGDGSVSVSRPDKSTGNPPGYAAVDCELKGISGRLQSVDARAQELRLIVDMHQVLIVNRDDELEVHINGEMVSTAEFAR